MKKKLFMLMGILALLNQIFGIYVILLLLGLLLKIWFIPLLTGIAILGCDIWRHIDFTKKGYKPELGTYKKTK